MLKLKYQQHGLYFTLNKKIIYEDEEDEEPKQKEFSYVESTRKSAMQQMQDKINEDRMRFLYQKYILR